MNKLRILIADDEEGIRESLRLVLGTDCEVTCVSDGERALNALDTHGPFDLVLLDIKMPKVDGLEILKYLKNNGNLPPVLMLTAYQSVELAKEAVKLGARDYIPKPFEHDKVVTAIHSILYPQQ